MPLVRKSRCTLSVHRPESQDYKGQNQRFFGLQKEKLSEDNMEAKKPQKGTHNSIQTDNPITCSRQSRVPV